MQAPRRLLEPNCTQQIAGARYCLSSRGPEAPTGRQLSFSTKLRTAGPDWLLPFSFLS